MTQKSVSSLSSLKKTRRGVSQGTVITPLDTIAGRTILESVAAIKPKTNLLLTVSYPKAYLYRRIVMAKLFIDINYADQIDIGEIEIGRASCRERVEDGVGRGA